MRPGEIEGTAVDARCRIELLGELRVLQGGRGLTRFRTQKAALLLSYLALHLGQNTTRETLIDLFWPAMDLEEGRNNLNTTLTSLRRQLEPPGVPAGSVLITGRHAVRLNPAAVATDLLEFDQLLHAAAGAGSPAERAALLGRAAGLYRGEMLTGCYDEWALLEQARWSARHTDMLEQWAEAQEESGELESALETAREAVRADPYREAAHRRQMRLYARLGRGPAALTIYEELERFLTTELGLSPAAETRELAERIRRDAEPPAAARTPAALDAAGVREPGAADLQSAAPEEPARIPISGQEPSLPLQLTRFFGREAELERLRELLQPVDETASAGRSGLAAAGRAPTRGSRLVTLTAPGGSGKTRLAIEAAQEVAPAFAGRVWFVDLAGLPDPNLIPFAVSNALQLAPVSNGDPLQPVVEALGDAPGLLLLDNFEHLLRDPGAGGKNGHPAGSGGGAAFVRLLLERVPRLTCLVTSRQPLHLGGEQEFPLPPLPVPKGSATPEGLLECGSVTLYVDRAQAAKPDFAVTPQNAAAVAALCRKLEGMPLAIEMAAAWAKTLPPTRMLERLEHQLDLLVSRRRDLPPRQQSLRATIQWSYDLLSPELKTWFARLGIFRGGWTLEAAETVCGDLGFRVPSGRSDFGLPAKSLAPDERTYLSGPIQNPQDALLLLSELQARSLIVADEEARYRLLEPLREFALERLTPEEHAALARRHAEFFLGVAKEASAAGEEAGLAGLEREHENLLAALEWSLSAAEGLPLGLALGAALCWFWQTHNHFREGREYLSRLLDRVKTQEPHSPAAHVRVAHGLARLTLLQGDGTAADPFYDEALCLARAYGDAEMTATILCDLAPYERDRRDRQAKFEESLVLFRSLGDQKSVGQVLVGLATSCFYDDLTRARSLFQEGLSVFRQLGAKASIAWCLVHLGDLAYRHGDYSIARSHVEESFALFRVLGDRMGVGCSLNRLGRLALVAGRLEEARSYQEQALQLAQEMDARTDMCWVLTDLGDLDRAEGDRDRAAERYARVVELSYSVHDPGLGIGALIGLARLAEQVVDAKEAAAQFAELAEMGKERNEPQLLLISLEGLAGNAARSCRPERAARLLGAAAAHRAALDFPMPPLERSDHEGRITSVRTALGEEWFEAAWRKGQALTLEQAVAEALAGNP